MRRIHDALTLELFDVPEVAPPTAGTFDLDKALRAAIVDAIKHSDLNRYEIAAEMSRLTGCNVTEYMLDAYTSASRQDYNFPMRYAAAFEMATSSYCLTQLMSKTRGCKLLVGDEALLAELGRLEQLDAEIKSHRAAIKQQIKARRP